MASEVVTLEVSCRRLPRRTILQVEEPGTFREASLQGEGIKKQENQGWGEGGGEKGGTKEGRGAEERGMRKGGEAGVEKGCRGGRGGGVQERQR